MNLEDIKYIDVIDKHSGRKSYDGGNMDTAGGCGK
jgi:hypothetical protein